MLSAALQSPPLRQGCSRLICVLVRYWKAQVTSWAVAVAAARAQGARTAADSGAFITHALAITQRRAARCVNAIWSCMLAALRCCHAALRRCRWPAAAATSRRDEL